MTETIHVPAHATRQFPRPPAGGDGGDATVLDGETWGNKHIDVSEPGARVTIAVTGHDWTVENIAITGGVADAPDGGRPHAFDVSVAGDSTGTLRNIWLADAPAAGDDAVAAGVRVRGDHAGELTIAGANIQHRPQGGIDATPPTDGQVTIERCYLARNGDANCRVGAPTATIDDCVVRTPTDTPGDRARGVVHTAGDLSITDSHVAMHAADYAVAAGGEPGTVTMTGGAVSGATTGGVVRERVGSAPKAYVPAGCPTSPGDAAVRPGGDTA